MNCQIGRVMMLVLELSSTCKQKRPSPQIYYTVIPMKATKDQLHQVWYQCMQMAQCSPQSAVAFLNQVHPLLNTPLTNSAQTLLMLAASISSPNLIRAALYYHPNLQLTDSIGRTALHYAAAVGSIEIFELLVKAGSKVDPQTIGGQTPLSKACVFSQSDIIEWYLNNSLATFEKPDRMGNKPLHALKTGSQTLYDEVIEVYRQLTEDTAMKE